MIEKRLARARAASSKASEKVRAAQQKLDIQCRVFRAEKIKPLYAAQKAARDAIAAITAIELEAAGIVPGKTVVRDYNGLWVVRIKASGYAKLDPVTKNGKPHMGKYAKPTPYRLSHLQITTIEVANADP
jgi:hypothetical protein